MSTFSEADNGTSVSVSACSTFNVSLPGNPTTGFIWAALPVENVQVEQGYQGSRPPGPPGAPQICGAGGHFAFRVTPAVNAGNSFVFEAHYKRPRDAGEGAKKFVLNVAVTE